MSLYSERGLRLRGDGLTDIQVTKGFYQSFNFASKTIRSIANTQPPPTASQVASAFVIANSKHLNLAPICSSILCNAIESFKECFNDAKLMQAFDVRIFRSLPCAESSADPPLKVYSGVAIDQMNIKSGNYQILILNSDSIWPLESTQTITDFETFSLLEDRRKQLFLSHATIIKQSNANLVVCSGQLSPIIDCNLRANGILVFDSLSDLQIQSISEAISKPICYRLSEISSNSVGFATISQIKDGWSDICLIAASNLKDCCKVDCIQFEFSSFFFMINIEFERKRSSFRLTMHSMQINFISWLFVL